MTNLFPTWVVGSVDLTEYPYSVDRDNTVEVGEPEMIVEGTPSGLSDGDIERVVRHGNRAYVLPIYVEGPTLLDVAEAEARLRSEIRRLGVELTHDPGDGFAPASVYEVQTARLTPARNDDHESHLMRKFTLTLTCGPFARSKDLVTIEALSVEAVPTTATVTNADATTGFTATGYSLATNSGITPAVTDVGAAVSTSASALNLTLLYAPASPVALTGTEYLVVEASDAPYIAAYATYAGGSLTTLTKRLVRATADGTTQYVFSVDPSKSLANLRLDTSVPAGGTTDQWLTITVHDISRTDTLPQISTKQVARIVEVGGTERTPASIHVEKTTGSDGLGGVTILHTSPEDGSGYSPPLRRWRTPGGSTGPVTSSSTALSGGWEDINYVAGGFNATVPTSALPEGGYVLMVRVRSATADLNTGRLYWSTSTLMGDSTEQQGYTNGSIPIALGSTPLILPVAALSLPSVRTTNGKVEIVLQAIAGGAQIQLDEAWLFRADEDCALTIVDNFQDNLWVDSPDVSSPVPRVWIGASVGGRNHPGSALQAMGNHVLHPDGTAVFTAALSDNPATRATFHRRWHSNAAS